MLISFVCTYLLANLLQRRIIRESLVLLERKANKIFVCNRTFNSILYFLKKLFKKFLPSFNKTNKI